MATIKVACPKCGQKVSGDESFFGTTVECPICSSDIRFPGEQREDKVRPPIQPIPPDRGAEEPLPRPGSSSNDRSPGPQPSPDPTDKAAASSETKSAPRPQTMDEEDDANALPPSPIYGSIAIVSAVLSVVTCVGGILFAPLAIIFGHTALAKAKNSPVQPAPGHTLGAIGLMIGYVSLVFLIILLLVLSFFGDTIREAIGQRAE